MKKEKFSVSINASAKKVWQVLWSDATYRQWTSAFSEGSYAVSDWKQGSKIQFLSPNGDGMFAIISEIKPFQLMAFSHLGEIKNFKEQPPKEGGESWKGSQEIYTLTETNGTTNLEVSMDVTKEFEQYFSDVFPKALQKVKELAEKPVVITIETEVKAPIEKIWEHWNEPAHIVQWATASDDWHTTRATNDLKPGGQFVTRMEAKDGSMGFDFAGTYTNVVPMKKIAYKIGDGRNVDIDFISKDNGYRIIEKFEAEEENPIEMQQGGWQAILNNFKKNVESNKYQM
jgi:uncharacterized protein YndB with AHSA1/START domain